MVGETVDGRAEEGALPGAEAVWPAAGVACGVDGMGWSRGAAMGAGAAGAGAWASQVGGPIPAKKRAAAASMRRAMPLHGAPPCSARWPVDPLSRMSDSCRGRRPSPARRGG
jgi:hypothetical protein